ncbi:hypothetical protein BD410DRAFT_871334 [Rickenella mellea]|uniref:Aminoglycoside phosphotransferase domain-containing protein n=1 Tax=Rickenella mellea TaxID=50990 RepID=A0A4Y7PZ75_9AGAM|nr:hypothetical protein BD410DRAFT_871334 [Rickenella mellea]
MRFVTQHTQIPVPYVWLQVQIFDVYYTFMTRINGKCLQDIWPNLSHSDRELIVRQLRNFMQQLRSIPPPPRSNICSILGGRVCCYRLFDRELSGPFRDEQHLNAQLRNGRSIDTFPPEVAVSHNKIHPLVLTHNDFFPRNIMVSGTNVTAVLDWECAGWFPSHWEYCKSVNWGKSWRPELLEWVPWVEQIIEPFYEEAKADEVLLKMIFQPTQHIP